MAGSTSGRSCEASSRHRCLCCFLATRTRVMSTSVGRESLALLSVLFSEAPIILGEKNNTPVSRRPPFIEKRFVFVFIFVDVG